MSRKRIFIFIAGLLAGGLLVALFSGSVLSMVAEPKYESLRREGNIEIRRYPALLAAEVETSGERLPAINDGFRLLADFIFGNNTASTKIAMTAPVTQQASEKIAMTAPVTQQSAGDNVWRVRFMMPDTFTKDTLPLPNNPKVKIVTLPSATYAVIRFSGSTKQSNLDAHANTLNDYVNQNNLTPLGPQTFAFYNPPWTLPFLKRNEIAQEIRQ